MMWRLRSFSKNNSTYIKPEKTKSTFNPIKSEPNRFHKGRDRNYNIFPNIKYNKNFTKSEFHNSKDRNSARRSGFKQRKDFNSRKDSRGSGSEGKGDLCRNRGKSARNQRRERANIRKRSSKFNASLIIVSSSHARAYRPKVNDRRKWVDFEVYDTQIIGYKDAKGLSFHDRALARAAKTNCMRFLSIFI